MNNLENEELEAEKFHLEGKFTSTVRLYGRTTKEILPYVPGNEVRLMNAYFVTCNSFVKDENGKVTEIHCTYDPASRGETARMDVK